MNDIWRLSPPAEHPFRGKRINRGKRISFSINDTRIAGFAGDTLLSALIANGFLSAGRFGAHQLALTEQFSPRLAATGSEHLAQGLLSAARTLAEDGMEYQVVGRPMAGRWSKMLGRDRLLPPSLEAIICEPIEAPDAEIRGKHIDADLIVIGGGAAGLSAAKKAANSGLSVILIEKHAYLGGNAGLFGSLEDEPKAEETIRALEAEVLGLENVTVFAGTGILDIDETRLLLSEPPRQPRRHNKLFWVSAPRIIVATGCFNPVPVAPGNRLPGVTGLAEAWRLGAEFGIWPGNETVFWGATNIQYRLAMLAKDAGISVRGIFDHRFDPQSRFKDFAKAYGITFSAGMDIARIEQGQNSSQLEGVFTLSMQDNPSNLDKSMTFDRLVVGNGWQPALTEWVRLGGTLSWHGDKQHFVASAGPDHIRVAGSAAGWEAFSACLASGEAAVTDWLGAKPTQVTERRLDAIYETPDGAMKPRLQAAQRQAFLSAGASLVRTNVAGDENLALGRLSLSDVTALVQAGAISPDAAYEVIAQRSDNMIWLSPVSEAPAAPQVEAPLPHTIVETILGAQWQMRNIQSVDNRALETGAFIYAGSDADNPFDAIGIILEGGKVSKAGFKAGHTSSVPTQLVIRSTAGMSYAELV